MLQSKEFKNNIIIFGQEKITLFTCYKCNYNLISNYVYQLCVYNLKSVLLKNNCVKFSQCSLKKN